MHVVCCVGEGEVGFLILREFMSWGTIPGSLSFDSVPISKYISAVDEDVYQLSHGG